MPNTISVLKIVRSAAFVERSSELGLVAVFCFKSADLFAIAAKNVKAIALEAKRLGFNYFSIQCQGLSPLEYNVDNILIQNPSDMAIADSICVAKPKGVFTFKLDLDGVYKDLVVPECLRDRLWGFAPEEFIGSYMESILPPEIAGDRRKHFQDAILFGKPISYKQIVTGFPVSDKIVSIYPENDEVLMFVQDT